MQIWEHHEQGNILPSTKIWLKDLKHKYVSIIHVWNNFQFKMKIGYN